MADEIVSFSSELAENVESRPIKAKHFALARSKLWGMREGADKNKVQDSWKPRVIAQEKETAASAKRNLNRQEEQIAHPAAQGGRSESNMPMRTPMWYRHWGLNE